MQGSSELPSHEYSDSNMRALTFSICSLDKSLVVDIVAWATLYTQLKKITIDNAQKSFFIMCFNWFDCNLSKFLQIKKHFLKNIC